MVLGVVVSMVDIAEDLEPIDVVLKNDEDERAVDVDMDAIVLLWHSSAKNK